MGRTIDYVRNGSSITYLLNYTNPATGLPFDDVAVTALACRILDPSSTPSTVLLTTTPAVFDTVAKQWKLTHAATLIPNGTRMLLFEAVPTRAITTAAALWPEVRMPIDATDIVESLEESQLEHDATQSAISQIAVASNAYFLTPSLLTVPESGSKTYKLRFLLRDVDLSPVTLVDPVGNQVDVTAKDSAGAAIAGITLGGAPAGRMTRDGAGDYSLIVTVASTVEKDIQVLWDAAFTPVGGSADHAIAASTTTDFDPQLSRIESQVNAIRATDVPAIQANVDAVDASVAAVQATLDHATYGLAALKAILDAHATSLASLHTKIGTNVDIAGTTTIFARLRQAVETYLADADFGLAALDDNLDAIAATIGVTTDTGGTTTTGTVDAKLNAILAELITANAPQIVFGVS